MIDLVKLYKEETNDNLLEDMKYQMCYVDQVDHLNDFLVGFEFDNNRKELVIKADKLLESWIGEECYIDEDDDIFMSVIVSVNTVNNIRYNFIMKLNISVNFETNATGYGATLNEPDDYVYTFASYKINKFTVDNVELLENFID